MKRSTFKRGEFQKCVRQQDILFVLRLCEALYWVEEIEQIEFCNHEAKNLIEPDVKTVEARRQCIFFICLEFHIFDVVFINSY